VGAVVTGVLGSVATSTAPDPRVVLGYLLILVAVVLVVASRRRFGRFDAPRAYADA
jgi:hypothetical protein